MEKCTFCVQRIRRSSREADAEGKEASDGDRGLNPACANACPTQALTFGDFKDPDSEVSKIKEKESQEGGRAYGLLENLGTNPSVVYLTKVDPSAKSSVQHG